MNPAFAGPERCALVALALPIATTAFSYLIPAELLSRVLPGVRVTVPFRNREITGYLVGTETAAPDKKLKSLVAILDDQPVLSPQMLELTKWVSEYYGSSWGEAIENALPRWVKFGKKTEKYIEKAKAQSAPVAAAPQEYTLSPEQKDAFHTIQQALADSLVSSPNVSSPQSTGRIRPALQADIGDPEYKSTPGFPLKACGNDKKKQVNPILVYGVTGSGKSELYIRAIRETLKQGRAAICLVPEIALTEQLQRFFAGHFGGNLEILHSKMTDGERFLTWKRIEMGTCRVVLGPRSAVFAPVPDLGLIIMDEEHEGSYKQETTPRYHAREVAAWRARNEKALFLMGTATPSLETMYLAEQGRVTRIDLTRRIDEKAMPKVEVIDLKRYEGDKKASSLFSPLFLREIETNLRNREGTMLLLNRRGFSTSIRCPACNTVAQCKSCQVSLTFHQEQGVLLCHYCNYQKKVTDTCGECKAPLLRFMGFGTEKVESEVARFFPDARIARMDADTTKKRDAHERILEQFRERKIDILIGTQMIAKGFDFPHVTLVGVVLADVGLRLPDFRSGERTFQLLTQFAGRAGRGSKPGRVYIQTYLPDHPSILCAKKHDFLGYYAHEKTFRRDFHYPPYFNLVNIIIRSRDEKKAYAFAREIRDALRKTLGTNKGTEAGTGERGMDSEMGTTRTGRALSLAVHRSTLPEIEIIGPAPLPFYKLRGHFRWHVMLKIPAGLNLTPELYQLLMGLKKPSPVAFQLDVDPLNIL